MDEGMRVVDADALDRIKQIIAEHAADLETALVPPGNYIVSQYRYVNLRWDISEFFTYDYRTEEHQTKMVVKSLNLDDAEIEESKRDLITREIGKFREVMKVIIITNIF